MTIKKINNLECLKTDMQNARQYFLMSNHFDNNKFQKCKVNKINFF